MSREASPPELDEGARSDAFGRRLDTIRGLLVDHGAAGGLFTSRRTFAWITLGGQHHVLLANESGVAALLVTPQEAVVLVPLNEAERIREEELGGLPLEVLPLPWEDPKAAAREAVRRAGDGVLDDEALEDDLMRRRALLMPAEHERLRWLGALTRRCLDEALATVRGGDDEDTLAADATARLARHGTRAPVVLVAADERIARYRHPLPVGAPIRRRVMLVLVAERWGLHVALTGIRELEPPTAELVRRAEAAAAVEAEMRAASRPGGSLGGVFAAAVAAYDHAGFPEEWRLHHQGGLIGYAARERIATPGDATTIEAGMAFAWNPSITGAKSERTFYLAPDGEEVIVTGA